jgi:signal transduction histidine kinase/ActR/RegA family two-component response regulator
MLDIFETFSKLKRGFPAAAISFEFKKKIQTLYQMTNKLEDYSLDAQDGLLVEELLLNGRSFEKSFDRFLTIENNIRELSTKKDSKQQYLIGQLHLAKVHAEMSHLRLEEQMDALRHFSLLLNGFMLAFLLFYSKQTINSFRRTVEETERIQDDLSYQIPIKNSDFIEFSTIYKALNSMANTINTQVKKLEESRNLMEDRVEERTRRLSMVNQQLITEIQVRVENEKKRSELEVKLNRAEKMEIIGTLAGGVAHDLNNILSAIISYPELILMDLPEDHRLREPLLIIKSSGEKAAVIVEDLLTLARRGVTTQEQVELDDVIRQFINSPECAKILFNHPAIKIETQLMSKKGLTIGSQFHLSKTIMNLVSNSAEAMHDGGSILITTSKTYVDFTIRGYDQVKEGEYLKLTVKDSGEGIAEEDMDRIFEPFFTKKQMGRSGTGLGMAVVWGTVKDHGGYIDVESKLGTGTTFTLYFPMSRDTINPNSDTVIPAEKYRSRGETVLVVDDGNEQRDIAKRMLEKLGYQVTCVPSGEKAIEYLQQHSADILLLDMIMPPGLNGLETYRRAIALAPGQKAVIASGFSESASVVEAQELGAGPYIKKPYDFEQIGLAIRAELDRKSSPTQ